MEPAQAKHNEALGMRVNLAQALDSFIGQYTVDWQHLFGASVVATIPVFILFALIEGRVVGGLTAGSVK